MNHFFVQSISPQHGLHGRGIQKLILVFIAFISHLNNPLQQAVQEVKAG